MGQILAVVSSKGGVGKTTTAVNLAAAFASLDFPTLLIEADPQCGIVANFGFDRFDIPRGLAEVARREARADQVTFETPVPGLHVISSNVWSQAEEADYLNALAADPLVFREMLAGVAAAYDYVIIDAPPMLGPITVAVLAAADRFIVPLQTEPQALRSLGRLVETAGQVRDRHNPGLRFDGIALTMVDSRTRLSMQVVEQVQADYPDLAFGNSIPRSVRLSEMAGSGRPLVVAAPASRGARAYAALAEEILLKHARERMMERAGDDDDDSPDPGGDEPNAPPTPTGVFPRTDAESTGTTGLDDRDADALEAASSASPGPQPEAGATAGNLLGLQLQGRVAIASGRIPEQGGDIHKSRRRHRNGHSLKLAPGVSGLGQAHGESLPGDRLSLSRRGGDVPGGAEHAAGVLRGTVSNFGGGGTTAGGGAFPDEESARDEWDDQNFVDLDTYMRMEAGMPVETGETTGAVAAEEDEWDDEWGK